MTINWQIQDFDEMVEYVAEMVGKDFIQIIHIANDIIEHPADYTGVQAAMCAKKLAAYRVKLSAAGAYMKLKTPELKRPQDRLIKDSILSMSDTMLELINTLKITVRSEQ